MKILNLAPMVFMMTVLFLTANCVKKPDDIIIKRLTEEDIRKAPLDEEDNTTGEEVDGEKTNGAETNDEAGSVSAVTAENNTKAEETNDEAGSVSAVMAEEKVDDWQYKPLAEPAEGALGVSSMPQTVGTHSLDLAKTATESIGFSVGGAKDINSFRENIKNNFLPLPEDITYEGLFYDYFFDTGLTEEKEDADPCGGQLFCPSYSVAVSKDPFSKKEEYFLSVGLNSGIKREDFSRKKLNLIVVMDISSSMSGPLDKYYYDQIRSTLPEERPTSDNEKGWQQTKMQLAGKAVTAMLDHLKPEDSLGVVLFDNQAHLAKPVRKVGATDMKAIKKHIIQLEPTGGTNMSAGFSMALEQFQSLNTQENSEVENRIIFLTDAQPNRGDLTEEGMLGLTTRAAKQNIYTTFIGVGLDFNTELIESITKIKGANYYSVLSPKEFTDRMDKYFDYMVTPLVFNLRLKVETAGFEVRQIYGAPGADLSQGEIIKVDTLFPSESIEGETRGGLVLLQLQKTGEMEKGAVDEIKLLVSYEDRAGTKSESVSFVQFEERGEDYYANTGIRKGIALSRYANLLRDWVTYERLNKKDWELSPEEQEALKVVENRYAELGIPVSLDRHFGSSTRWERQSLPLVVSAGYKNLFREFRDYFESEREILQDKTMDRELAVLKTLVNH